MIQVMLFISLFAMGWQTAFGKMDESKLKLKPGQTVEDVLKQQKITGCIIMALPVVLLAIQFLLI